MPDPGLRLMDLNSSLIGIWHMLLVLDFGKWLRSGVLYTLSLEFIKELLVPMEWFVSLQHTFAEILLSARPHATAVTDVPTQQMSLTTRGN